MTEIQNYQPGYDSEEKAFMIEFQFVF